MQARSTDKAVDLWVNNLQDLAYDIDDILDDLATEDLRIKLNQEAHASTSTSKMFAGTRLVSFAVADEARNTTSSSSSFLLPPSLVSLELNYFTDLESFSEVVEKGLMEERQIS
ncbi:hypothetical protein L1887_18143 [Cichorium endivia]|nr:hypothetical protein L1887_18143 [Cichorium endivia]